MGEARKDALRVNPGVPGLKLEFHGVEVSSDAGFFAIEPETLQLRYRDTGPDANTLGISASSIDHLRRKPHPQALKWLWDKWQKG